MSIISLIIKREFITKVRNKSFIVMTFLSPLLFVGIALLVGYLSSLKADVKVIGIHDESGLFVNEFVDNEEFHYSNMTPIDLKTIKDSIVSKNIEGLIYIPKSDNNTELQSKIQYISNESPGMSFVNEIESTIESKLTQSNLKNANLDAAAIDAAKAKVNITLEKATGGESVRGLNEIKVAIGGLFGYLIMMFIIIYGNMVMRSVIEEKTSRIVEIIISSVKPFQLMMGKIIGTSLAGILQFAIWSVLGLILMSVASTFLGVDAGAGVPSASVEQSVIAVYLKELMNLPIATIIISFIIYFIGGYFLYSSFYAAIGAAVDNETDSQQFLMPIIMPLILGVYIGFFTVMNDPHGTVATVFSMIPLTSPIVMLMRIPFGVPLWEIAISVTILFATFMGVVWFAAKIYRVGILMYGKKPTYREMLKWLKY